MGQKHMQCFNRNDSFIRNIRPTWLQTPAAQIKSVCFTIWGGGFWEIHQQDRLPWEGGGGGGRVYYSKVPIKP